MPATLNIVGYLKGEKTGMSKSFRVPLVCAGVLAMLFCMSQAASGQLIISEFRLRGPNGANDEFIEIYNNSGADHTVAASSGSGYGVAASDGTTRCSLPNGTVIPNRGHYLCVNSVGYSLASYPAGNGTTATGDATYTTDIPDNAGIALFNNNSGGLSYSLANRMDAVGSTSEANTLYKEGTGIPITGAEISTNLEHSLVRHQIPGLPVDTGNNATDFIGVDVAGNNIGGTQRLGAPGPENLASPITRIGQIPGLLLDSTKSASAAPNRVRDLNGEGNNPAYATFGTLSIRRRFVNNTGANVTRLRFRIANITTFAVPGGTADLRALTSSDTTAGGVLDAATCAAEPGSPAPPCIVTVRGTTLDQPPAQSNGGGWNSSLSVGFITLAQPLAAGDSVNVQFLLGVQQTGTFRFFVNVEALP